MRQHKGTYNIESNENASHNSDVGGRQGEAWSVVGGWELAAVSHQCHTVSRVTLGHAGTMTDDNCKHAAIWPGLTVPYCNI